MRLYVQVIFKAFVFCIRKGTQRRARKYGETYDFGAFVTFLDRKNMYHCHTYPLINAVYKSIQKPY